MKYPRGIIIEGKKDESGTVTFHENELIDNPAGLAINQVGGNFSGKALYLNSDYNWHLVKDSEDVLILVPTKK